MKLRGLRQARQRSGLSISQLAELTGLRRDTITHLEHGKEEPQPYVMRRLASALDATSAELVGVGIIEPAAPSVASSVASSAATGATAPGITTLPATFPTAG